MPSAILAQLSLDNEPVEHLYPGWGAVSRHPAPGGMDVVLFREHDTGREACWWVTPDGNHLASHALALKPDRQDDLINNLNPILQPLMEGSLIHTPQDHLPVEDPTFKTLMALPATALKEAVGLWFHHAAPETMIIAPDELISDSAPSAEAPSAEDTTDADSPFSAERVRQLMENRYHDDQPPVVVSPFSGLPLKTQLVMKNKAGVACRFSDPIDQLTFYLFWPHPSDPAIAENTVPPIFYYPQGPLILGDGYMATMLPTRLMVWFLRHPDHPEQIRNAPPFRLEDYGVGHISGIWDSFSQISGTPQPTYTEASQQSGQMLPPPNNSMWDQFLPNTSHKTEASSSGYSAPPTQSSSPPEQNS